MGVAAPRSARRLHGIRRRPSGRAGPRTVFPVGQGRTGRSMEPWELVERATLWDKLHDDRTLIGLKIVLLAFLFLLTALLEWATA